MSSTQKTQDAIAETVARLRAVLPEDDAAVLIGQLLPVFEKLEAGDKHQAALNRQLKKARKRRRKKDGTLMALPGAPRPGGPDGRHRRGSHPPDLHVPKTPLGKANGHPRRLPGGIAGPGW